MPLEFREGVQNKDNSGAGISVRVTKGTSQTKDLLKGHVRLYY